MTRQTVTRLSQQHLPAGIALPGYDRTAARVGIVHFGLGAFTRAHQAWYTDRAMAAAGGNWLTLGVSLRSPEVGAQLNPQDGLYTLAVRSGAGTERQVIGAVRKVLLATAEREAVVTALAHADTHVVTFTVTEKGYCRKADGSLDLTLADAGFYPLVAEALARRQATGAGGLTLLSCDNLADNGHQLRRLLLEYLGERRAMLIGWVERHCTFPCSMVDRIVPATTAEERAAAAAALGLEDHGLVVTEPFSQWVIEDAFAGPRPAWEQVGAEIVAEVAPYETAKLRMLNGAHSALAYCGLLAGHSFVHEAVGDPLLRPLVEGLMREEAAPTIAAAPGQDLDRYADALLERFANPALNHKLIQIAMDGSQKIPQRWLATLAANRQRGRACPAILTAVAAWLRHVRGDNAARWGSVDDPRAAELAAAWAAHGTAGIVAAVFGPDGLLASDWVPSADDSAMIGVALGDED
ncbi:mannitol dehydrogenase family protein [Novosphingobium aerophilum]|uniref:mannitol dehydrogenase family protein n=1 Tax=Novosphingobium aerophilum TaxID=2839843 RepID=UPI002E2ADA87|nr:mannitol dehydrogenase family protein [Novosphingobium aerophilum]